MFTPPVFWFLAFIIFDSYLRLRFYKFLQGHPMDLFLKISILQANLSWLGDLGKKVRPWKETVAAVI